MGRRQRLISTSILRAIFRSNPSAQDARIGLLAHILAFFSIFHLTLSRYRKELFKKLRNEIWHIEEEEYIESFRSPSKSKRTDLVAVGDLGYSGSTFFTTPDSKYLLKSLPRKFEQDFFRDRLLAPYAEHMEYSSTSLLVRITDLLYAPSSSIGTILGTTPSHHIVMEDILYGKSRCTKAKQKEWETYDLKPIDYFYPERDIAGGRLAPESVKERLIDKFPDRIRVSVDEKEELVAQLSRDTRILQDANAVDYSLFLVRYPASMTSETDGKVPVPPGTPSPWRTGVLSRDKKWIYRAILLDFFWAKDAFQAKAMTGLINSWNFLSWGKSNGPMSITTTSDEYRTRFLKMVESIVEVPDSSGRPSGEDRNLLVESSEEV
ncbi:phosphatidylinositol-4-phosphate 5-kinase-domain-containing protein [Clohesyomyces aquaticus]|uniref:Phosphatidylinositol-4-phosphate 5-kinase-domain-containing protein n=1 Tax=Clohesyomyces aquaticus TaxID=1231657 RepID=A0A1Y1ZQ00_9PLEO|nr:phosphatidylinositol-4-phosphate 5-kinase-domain-containing protein [Clohesyomyces aquaticus]